MSTDLGGTELYSQDLLTRGEVKTGYISIEPAGSRQVTYTAIDGLAIFEGDIILGTVEEMELRRAAVEDTGADERIHVEGVIRNSLGRRWTNNVVPYAIDPSLPDSDRVTDAIAQWQSRTPLQFVKRTTENNYVIFKPSDGCSSYVGMIGGQQPISLSAGCGVGTVMHEIGHAVGLWHEQSRADRDSYVTVHYENIKSGKENNFNQHINDGEDVATYDYGSIMHYGEYAFSSNGKPTIVPTDPDAQIGQREALSNGDLLAVKFMYLFDNLEPITGMTLIAGDSKNIPAPPGYSKYPQDLNEGAGGKYIYLCYTKEPGDPITDVIAIAGDKAGIEPPEGYTRIDQDTNEGAGGKYIYLCYKKGGTVGITNMSVITGDSQAVFPPAGSGFVRVNQDLKEGAGGKFVYFCYQPDPGAQITDIKVISGSDSSVAPPDGYERISIDLNMGAGGKFVYLCYEKSSGVPVTDIKLITGNSPDIAPPEGYTKIDRDLNAGAGGKYVYLCYKQTDGDPLIALDVIYGSNSSIQPPPGYVKLNQDVNQGSSGKYIYICYKNTSSTAPGL